MQKHIYNEIWQNGKTEKNFFRRGILTYIRHIGYMQLEACQEISFGKTSFARK